MMQNPAMQIAVRAPPPTLGSTVVVVGALVGAAVGARGRSAMSTARPGNRARTISS